MVIPVYLEWTHNGIPQDAVWKPVEMPCLPPIGARFWANDARGEIGCLTVKTIEWWEHVGGLFEVHLDEVDFSDGTTVEESIAWLRELGWRRGQWFDSQDGVIND